MTLRAWASNTVDTFRERNFSVARKLAQQELWLGTLRRANRLAPPGEPHWNREWDVLVILDACRSDLMREACCYYEWLPSPATMDTLWSVGSSSLEWMGGMFDEAFHDAMSDTAYVTANMFAEEVGTEPFGVYCPVDNEFVADLDLRLTPPEKVTEHAVEVWRRRAELDVDRMIVHYMQPHTPFRSRPEWFDADDRPEKPWGWGYERLLTGELPLPAFRDAYRDNLAWVLSEVERFVENCAADILLSADHGNALGEWHVYGHPSGVHVPAVRSVPLVPVSGTDERTLEPELPEKYVSTNVSKEDVETNLRDLGYL